MEWNISFSITGLTMSPIKRFDVTIEIIKSNSVSVKFSQQAYTISTNAKLSWINEMAFALSPLSLDSFPFKIIPIENMLSTATDEALPVSSFCDWFQVFKLHMGLPEQN